MLQQRVITAIVLLLVLAAVLASPWPLSWPVFLALVSGLAVWEWLRMTSHKHLWVAKVGAVLVFLGLVAQAIIWQSQPSEGPGISLAGGVFGGSGASGFSGFSAFHASVWISSIVWLFLVPFTLISGRVQATASLPVWGLFAPVCLYATWGGLVLWWLQGGIWLVLSLLILVWIADIFAYFGGKRWGRNKLAPAISPGKTREGAFTGLAGVVVWMLVTANIDGSYAQLVLTRYGWALLIAISLLLGIVSIMGDLFESLLKRRVQIKDSSGLLPGHGGVYDRIDAVVAVVPVAYLITHSVFSQ